MRRQGIRYCRIIGGLCIIKSAVQPVQKVIAGGNIAQRQVLVKQIVHPQRRLQRLFGIAHLALILFLVQADDSQPCIDPVELLVIAASLQEKQGFQKRLHGIFHAVQPPVQVRLAVQRPFGIQRISRLTEIFDGRQQQCIGFRIQLLFPVHGFGQ